METRQTWAEQVTARVRSAIKESDKTEEAVGIAAGIPNATLSRRLNGHYPLTIADLEKIAEVLDISPSTFLPSPEPRAEAKAMAS